MKISQLIRVMDKDDEIIIDDVNERIDRNRVYQRYRWRNKAKRSY